MPIKVDSTLDAKDLAPAIERLFELSAAKILSLERSWNPDKGAPVFTVGGRYAARGWTEWTQGFQFGSALLQYDATGDERFLELGRRRTLERMATHVSHMGVHDHGFNNVSTYGNLLRLMREGRMRRHETEEAACVLALEVSGAVQAARWTRTREGGGFIYSFNGPHSLFIDTMRSLRSLAASHQLGHALMGEHDERISLLDRLTAHGLTTARWSVYYGAGRDIYDLRGRVAHESVFNTADGRYRCPNSQQGYSPFSTWTRGLAWAICGFAEQLEFLEAWWGRRPGPAARADRLAGADVPAGAPRRGIQERFLEAARATADFYLENCCADGVPVWDTGAPNLHRLPSNYLERAADPFNRWEPVDSSAAAIAAQGLIRLGNHLALRGDVKSGRRYRQAGLTTARTLFAPPYLSTQARHQGLLLHSIYHRPNGWDRVAAGQRTPNGESSMWGDYHLRELALLLWREARREPYLTFFLK